MPSVLSRTYTYRPSRVCGFVANADYREGTHAKYHYMICGVQGDFTRSLVNDPPRTLWTRELKVCDSVIIRKVHVSLIT